MDRKVGRCWMREWKNQLMSLKKLKREKKNEWIIKNGLMNERKNEWLGR